MTDTNLTDLDIGDSAPPLVIEDLERVDFVKYAGASGDFNPIHTDETFAKDAGNESVFGHGMLTAGFVSSYVSNWFGVDCVTRLRTRFQSRLWPGDTVTVHGEITDVETDGTNPTYTVSVTAENQDDEVLVTGSADIES